MRHSVSKLKVEPSGRVTSTVTVWRGLMSAMPVMVKLSSPVRPSVSRARLDELERQHAHADKVRAVDAFEAFDG